MRTHEELEAYFNAFKLKKQKQKEKQSQRKKAKSLDEYKAIEKRLKEEKIKKANQIIQWHQQWLQTVLKQPIQQFYETDVGDFNEDNLYLTREELQEWERKHYPCINWDNWDRIVQQTKQTLQLLFLIKT